MTSDGKIYITISDKRGGDGITPGPGPNPSPNPDDKDNAANDFLKHKFFNFIEQTANKIVNNSINQIGNMEGDYEEQRQIQSAISAAKQAENIAISFLVGSKMSQSFAGGVVGSSLAVASMVVNYGIEENNNRIAITKQNKQIAIIRDLSGLNTLKDGSRGTEN